MLEQVLRRIGGKQEVKAKAGEVHSYLCLNQRSGRDLCQACQEICPRGSITAIPGQFAIQHCVGCGLCAAVCPTGVFDELWMAAHKVLNAAQDPRPQLWITCHRNPGPRDAVQVYCLGELQPELIVFLLHQGIGSIQIFYQPEACNACECAGGQRLWEQCRERLDLMYRESSSSVAVASAWMEPCGEGVDYARRGALRSLSQGGKQLLGEVLGGNREGAVLPRYAQALSLRQQLIRYLLECLPPAQADELKADWQAFSLGETCSFCGSCILLCPSGALACRQSAEGHILISVDPAICNGCALCQAICPAAAIKEHERGDIRLSGGRILLLEGEVRSCMQCRRSYWGQVGADQQRCWSCRHATFPAGRLWME